MFSQDNDRTVQTTNLCSLSGFIHNRGQSLTFSPSTFGIWWKFFWPLVRNNEPFSCYWEAVYFRGGSTSVTNLLDWSICWFDDCLISLLIKIHSFHQKDVDSTVQTDYSTALSIVLAVNYNKMLLVHHHLVSPLVSMCTSCSLPSIVTSSVVCIRVVLPLGIVV